MRSFAIHDVEVDDMYPAYQQAGARYFVVVQDGQVLGGGGVAPLTGADKTICELRKMYFLPAIRGKGLGQKLIRLCMQAAQELGYRTMYLETLSSMQEARALYEKSGFTRLAEPLGATGHFGCNAWYIKALSTAQSEF